MILDGEVVLGRKLLTTLPSIGPSYKISFDLFVNSFLGVDLQHGDWAEVLRFTCTNKDCCAPGDRIPIVLTNKGGKIAVATQVGDHGNYGPLFLPFHLKTWKKVEIQQFSHHGKVNLNKYNSVKTLNNIINIFSFLSRLK